MGPDKDDIDDEKVLDKQELGEDEGQDEAPQDVRGAIRAAIEETKGDDDKSDDDKSDKEDKEADEKSKKEDKPDRSVRKEHREEQHTDKEPKQEVKEDKTEPPPFYKVKGKTVWDKLAPEDKQLIIAREQEVSQGFAQISPKVRAFDELEKVISPRLQAIQQFGATPAQTIDKLFQWMELLSDQDESKRTNGFKQLAANFGINLAQISESPRLDGTDPSLTVDQTNPPPWAQGLVGEVTTLKQQLTAQQQAAADAAVTNWATAKDSTGTSLRPHYSKVNELMYKLLQNGTVPMKDGNLDLDGAYELACKISPEVSALIQQEQAQKSEQEKKDKEAKDAQLAKARLEKAKKAGVGLKPAAPSMPSTQAKGKPNGTGKSTSVRESLKQSLDELRDN